ncbi:GGDEF domain-containing protein [Thalassotalea nanhaiensis]|uniref:diguanylate cyclase n=1 Tax=Thalassotalea nanhaiensis TaxID=3065648 RepID=A0ABY9TIX9_9GAMM|nr:GGDEF domain-containing protein [Colwelliaceae bacterium SQ345]
MSIVRLTNKQGTCRFTSAYFLCFTIMLLLTLLPVSSFSAENQTVSPNKNLEQSNLPLSFADIDALLAQALEIKSSNKKESARIIKKLAAIEPQLSYRQQGELTYLTAYNAYLTGDRHKAVALHKVMQDSKLLLHRVRASSTLLNLYLIEQNYIMGGKLIPLLLEETEKVTDANLKGDVFEVVAYYYTELNQPEIALTYLSLVNTESYLPRDYCYYYNRNSAAKLQLYGYLAEQSFINNGTKVCEQAGEFLSANILISEIALHLIDQQEYQLALDILLPKLSKAEAINYNNLSLNFYSYIATAYFHLNDFDQALLFANKAENINMPIKYHKSFAYLYATLSDLHFELGNNDKALEYLYVYQDKLAVALDVEQQRQLARAQADHYAYGKYRVRDKLIKETDQAEAKYKAAFGIMMGYINKFENGRILFAVQVFIITILCCSILGLRHFQITANEKNRLDPLTKLFNRQRFVDLAANTVYLHKKWTSTLTLLVINIDNFRGFNQQHGCEKGDELLKLIGQILHNYAFRVEDVARSGADEFSLLLQTTDAQEGIEVAKQIQMEIAQLSDELKLKDDIVNVSIGISDTVLSESSLKYLLCDSSRALREAKKNGGNKIFCFDRTMTDREKYKIEDDGLKYIFEK